MQPEVANVRDSVFNMRLPTVGPYTVCTVRLPMVGTLYEQLS